MSYRLRGDKRPLSERHSKSGSFPMVRRRIARDTWKHLSSMGWATREGPKWNISAKILEPGEAQLVQWVSKLAIEQPFRLRPRHEVLSSTCKAGHNRMLGPFRDQCTQGTVDLTFPYPLSSDISISDCLFCFLNNVTFEQSYPLDLVCTAQLHSKIL